MTPIRTKSGATRDMSNDSSCTISVVPTLAPSMTASPGTKSTSPPAANPETIRPVAVLLCSKAVMPRPARKAFTRLPSARPSSRRKCGPNARWIPLWTMCTPHSRSAIDPARSIRVSVASICALPEHCGIAPLSPLRRHGRGNNHRNTAIGLNRDRPVLAPKDGGRRAAEQAAAKTSGKSPFRDHSHGCGGDHALRPAMLTGGWGSAHCGARPSRDNRSGRRGSRSSSTPPCRDCRRRSGRRRSRSAYPAAMSRRTARRAPFATAESRWRLRTLLRSGRNGGLM